MKSKTIILSAKDTSPCTNSRGILTIYNEDDLLKCRLRLYNINNINRFCKLGIYHNKQVYSANLIEKNGAYETSFVGDFNFDQDFYTALIDTNNNNNVLLAGGTYAGYYFNEEAVFENVEQPKTSTLIKPIAENPQPCENNCNNCQNCIYKEYFYNNQNIENVCNNQTNNLHNNEIKQTENNNINNTEMQNINENSKVEKTNQHNNNENKLNTTSLIKSLIPQFKYIFENYDLDEELNSRIKNGKFVKINENEDQFSIGAIYENENIKYLCYAIKRNYNTAPPKELGENYQWLPLDTEDPLSEGYYLVFQDAKDLKILEF